MCLIFCLHDSIGLKLSNNFCKSYNIYMSIFTIDISDNFLKSFKYCEIFEITNIAHICSIV